MPLDNPVHFVQYGLAAGYVPVVNTPVIVFESDIQIPRSRWLEPLIIALYGTNDEDSVITYIVRITIDGFLYVGIITLTMDDTETQFLYVLWNHEDGFMVESVPTIQPFGFINVIADDITPFKCSRITVEIEPSMALGTDPILTPFIQVQVARGASL